MRPLLFGIPICLAACGAWGQSMKPGLWEHRFQVRSQSGQVELGLSLLQQQLANLPPQQRQKMEQMMASKGVHLNPSAQSAQVCITPEQAARMELPLQDGRCQTSQTRRNGATVQVNFTCSGTPPAHGEATATFQSDTAYTGSAWVQTTVMGKPERMDITQSGRWLSSDCAGMPPR